MAASPSPVASPVAAPAPGTVEVKEEAKPEDTELVWEEMIWYIYIYPKHLDFLVRCWNYLGSWQGIQVYKHLVFLPLNKVSLKQNGWNLLKPGFFFTEMKHSRDCFNSVEVGMGWILSLCQLETLPGSRSGCARHDQMLLRFALHEYRGAGCCFERDAWTSFRGGHDIFEDAIHRRCWRKSQLDL